MNYPRGEQHPKHRLNILQVESIRYQRCAGRDSYRKIARRYSVAYSTIHAICTGRAWRHAPGPIETGYQRLVRWR